MLIVSVVFLLLFFVDMYIVSVVVGYDIPVIAFVFVAVRGYCGVGVAALLSVLLLVFVCIFMLVMMLLFALLSLCCC